MHQNSLVIFSKLSSSTSHVIHLLKNNASHSAEKKKKTSCFLFYPPVILSVQLFLLKLSKEEAALGTGLSSLQHPQKGFDAQVGGLKSLTGCHPGSWLRAAYLEARNDKHCRKKRGKEKERNMKEEIVREKDRKKATRLLLVSSEPIPVVEPSAEGRREKECSANTKARSTLLPLLLLLRFWILPHIGETTACPNQTPHTVE